VSLSAADLDRYVADVVEASHAVGVNVGVMQNGEVILAKGYGLANVEKKTPVTPDTLFAIGSVTKQFTCSVALQLEQEGKLSFADRVARYEPGLTRAHDITVRDLGNHVSGYRDYYPLDFVDRPMAADRPASDVWRDFASRPLDFEPGSRYSYSNTGYLLLGHIAEVAGREPFAQALERRLLTPLGLSHTRFEPTRGDPGLADGYTPMGLGNVLPSGPEGRGWIDAAGGLWSTPADLLAWDLALMDGKVLSPSSWKTMTTPRTLSDEYSAFLTPERLAAMRQSLIEAGEVTRADAGPIRERGGLEVSTMSLVIGTTPATTLMYRRPDGTVEEFLFYRR